MTLWIGDSSCCLNRPSLFGVCWMSVSPGWMVLLFLLLLYWASPAIPAGCCKNPMCCSFATFFSAASGCYFLFILLYLVAVYVMNSLILMERTAFADCSLDYIEQHCPTMQVAVGKENCWDPLSTLDTSILGKS